MENFKITFDLLCLIFQLFFDYYFPLIIKLMDNLTNRQPTTFLMLLASELLPLTCLSTMLKVSINIFICISSYPSIYIFNKLSIITYATNFTYDNLIQKL